ncbi:MAG: ribbon-helix-helix domain-containing protein [Candidatus Odinarchaeota archaeon]
MSSDYITVSLPRNLIDKVEELINSGEIAYTSKADFIKDAIRMKLRDLGVKI